jgi:hypothetical protein
MSSDSEESSSSSSGSPGLTGGSLNSPSSGGNSNFPKTNFHPQPGTLGNVSNGPRINGAFRQREDDSALATALAHGAAMVASGQEGTEGFLAATALPQSLLRDMQSAADDMAAAGTTVQLGDVAAMMDPDLAVGLLCFVRNQGNNVAYQIDGYNSQEALFRASGLVEKDHRIEFTRHELAVLPCAHYLTLAYYVSERAQGQLPLKDRKPRGLIPRLSANHRLYGISVADTARELCQLQLPEAALAARGGGMLPPLPPGQVQDGHSCGSRQHDPTKSYVTGLSLNAQLALKGELRRYMNAQYGVVYDAVMGRSGFGENKLNATHEIPILLSSEVCVELLSCKWVDLAWFETKSRDLHIMSKKSAGITIDREVWVDWPVEKVEMCWSNAKTLFDRLWIFAEELKLLWPQLWVQMQYLKIDQSDYYPLLKYGWVQYELLNEIARDFFATLTRPDLTEAQCREALDNFKIDEDSPRFRKSYGAKEKRHLFNVVNKKAPRDTAVDVTTDPNPTPKKKARAKAKAAAAAAAATGASTGSGNGGSNGGGQRKTLCYAFLSTAGCSRSACRHAHESAASLDAAASQKLKEALALRSWTPDPAKF